MKPKVLFFDIETKPVRAWLWHTGKQVVRHAQICDGERFDIICIAYKWLDKGKIHVLDWGLHAQNSAKMLQEFVAVLETADVVIAQNGDAFDIKQLNTQRLIHKQRPIAWPTSEDTRKMIRRHFYVTSSSLEYISKLLVGAGKDRIEFADWIDVIVYKKAKALEKMKRYCKNDVLRLFQVWKKIAPYCEPRFNRALKNPEVNNHKFACANCGSKSLMRDGTRGLRSGLFQRYRCKVCYAIRLGEKVK